MKNFTALLLFVSSMCVLANHNPKLSYSSELFEERLSNDGTIANSIIVTLSGDKFTGRAGEDFVRSGKVSIANYPQGLTVIVRKVSSKKIKLSLRGAASNHDNAGDIANLSISFHTSAFKYSTSQSVLNSVNNELIVDFID